MAIPRKIISYLKKNKINYEILKHEVAYTAQEIAAVQHISGDRVAKTVLIKTDRNFIFAVLPATYLIDFSKLKKIARLKKAVLAKEDEMLKLFPDIEPGAIPPLSPLFNLPIYVDKKLSENTEIVFNAGTHTEMLKMRYKDFEKINKPFIGSFSKHV
ncbi:MAG: YbaK/EbsC family protein [Candidatus Omnitrophica bacterium]|nr:YbaK/EbsC family protein [Candidatus Omnitrophota bacterium]MCM8793258.1 YbaK/EbsC family protein [Candidatus Omnitrophota bacterium]